MTGSGTVRPFFRPLFAVILIALAGALFFRSLPREAPIERRGFMMGTAVSIRALADEETLEAAFGLLHSLDETLSAHLETSEIGRVNAEAGSPTQLSPQTASLLAEALAWAERTDGAFDPTLRPLTRLWSGDGQNHRPPTEEAVARGLGDIGWKRVRLDGDSLLLETAMGLDLGGIAKGHAADETARLLRERHVASALIDLGGNIVVIGGRPDGGPWRIGIQDPRKSRGECLGVVEVRDLSVVSSGNYERFFEWEGRRYGHIVDPSTGCPADSDLSGVTVLSERSLDGDALATALFVMGREKASALAGELEKEGFAFILAGDDGTLYASPSLEGVFRLESKEYRLEER